MRDRKGVYLDERGGGEKPEGVKEEEIVIGIYYMKKSFFSLFFRFLVFNFVYECSASMYLSIQCACSKDRGSKKAQVS